MKITQHLHADRLQGTESEFNEWLKKQPYSDEICYLHGFTTGYGDQVCKIKEDGNDHYGVKCIIDIDWTWFSLDKMSEIMSASEVKVLID